MLRGYLKEINPSPNLSAPEFVCCIEEMRFFFNFFGERFASRCLSGFLSSLGERQESLCVCVYVGVCVGGRERERDRERKKEGEMD